MESASKFNTRNNEASRLPRSHTGQITVILQGIPWILEFQDPLSFGLVNHKLKSIM
jgi:hypothetical protein